MGLKLLCVVAHPDDECFAFGGALALSVEQGVETFVLCLTDGQAASNRGVAASPEELGRMRREEFRASCKVLGITRYEFMDYADGQLEFADFSSVASRLVALIRDWKPQVVLTFGSDGALNTHPDHTMVSAFTSAAFHWAGAAKRYPQLGAPFQAERLYFVTTNYFLEDRPSPNPTPWTVTLDVRGVIGRKQEAFRQHTSQAPLMERTKAMFEEFGEAEHYTLAAARKPQPAEQTTSFYAGLES